MAYMLAVSAALVRSTGMAMPAGSTLLAALPSVLVAAYLPALSRPSLGSGCQIAMSATAASCSSRYSRTHRRSVLYDGVNEAVFVYAVIQGADGSDWSAGAAGAHDRAAHSVTSATTLARTR